jgi:predicted DNA-binding transcriptional regulator YafY
MSKREAIARYNLIIKKIRRFPVTFQEVSDTLDLESELQSYNFHISKRTFQRDLDDIRSIYNIDIQYDFSKKVYYIDFDEQPEVNERILEAFDTFNALNISDRLSGYIHFEKRRPQGTENLYGLLHAIKNHLQIQFTYQKYWEDDLSERITEPYALKEFRNRWYVIAKDEKDGKIKSFALDRLTDLLITKHTFNLPADFNISEHYRYCFGIIGPNEIEPKEVILSFEPVQGKYIKSLPLNESQEIIKDDEGELVIKLRLFITHDFLMELLSYGETVKVIKPDSLIELIKSTYQKALGQYYMLETGNSKHN